jgi:hypothetical protein
MNLGLLNGAVLVFILSYIVFLYFFDCRQVTDERRELIRLKSLRISQKVISFILLGITIAHLFEVTLITNYMVAILVFSTCTSEILSKIYFERQY